MKCPKCNGRTFVKDSRYVISSDRSYKRRRYACEKCGFRFTTHENIYAMAVNEYDRCYDTQEYDGQNCKECPHLTECGGME